MKQRVTEQDAIDAFEKIHELGIRKRELTKLQKPMNELVKEYLDQNPDGFYVDLEDAKGNTKTYHVAAQRTERTTLDKEGLRAKIKLALDEKGEPYHIPDNIKASYLARMVEEGILEAEDIKNSEMTTDSRTTKKRKAQRPDQSVQKEEEKHTGPVTLKLGGEATLTVKRGDKIEVHKPKIIKNGEVVQEASKEVRDRTPEDDILPGNRWLG